MGLAGARRAAAGACAALLIVPAPALPSGSRDGRTLVLDASLTVASEVSRDARQAMIEEAVRIWSQAGVGVRFHLAPNGGPPPDARLRVLVIARTPKIDQEHNWVVGELLPLTGGRALAIASITSARRVAGEGRRVLPSDFPVTDERLAGIVLGRAIAHEIGHFILDSRTHAERGLMRASFDAFEFADPRADAVFGLDDHARQWLAGLARSAGIDSPSQMPSPAIPAFTSFSAGQFAYAQ
jgi:hypothetical protein